MVSVAIIPDKSNDILPLGQINKKTTKYNHNKMITKTLSAATLVMALFIGAAVHVDAAKTETSGKTISTHSNWAQNEPARFYITKYESTAQFNQKFIGNHSDYFMILHQTADTILVGGKNALYNLSIATLQEQPNTRIEWSATDAHRQLCMLKGKNEYECQNYIRVYGRIGEDKFLLCGTNAYKPQCREYKTQRLGFHNQHTEGNPEVEEGDNGNEATSEDTSNVTEYENEEEAQGRCPYNPQHSSSYVFAGKNLMLRGAPT